MLTACLFVAEVARASLPAPAFTLAWTHSIEKTRWEEQYRVDGDHLLLERARIQGMGAGMEAGAGAQLADGWWTWQPAIAPLRELRLSVSPYAADYTLCAASVCKPLAEWSQVAPDTTATVTLRACVR